ncbi:MAG: [FeFe] hydrogenase H-cluster radical SAM maturase HydE [Candidatus Omnitrophica bacterium]|nr:[FeFe] hydrogenase H-cluster radical SAM maturase HydE [Candidatus Omnitrophota bacterium]
MPLMKKKEIIEYLETSEPIELFSTADKVRKEFCGNGVLLRALIEFSNCCNKRCLYCGLNAENQTLPRYRLKKEAIIACVKAAVNDGLKTIVLQSGDDFTYTKDDLCSIVKGIKGLGREIAVTLSLGERSIDDYLSLKDSGADRVLLKFETTNETLYQKLHPGQSLKKRLELLNQLKQIGFQVGTGNIVGLPGQTSEDLAEDILFFKEFQPDMVGIGPFMPQKETTLAKELPPSVDLVLKVMALTRLATKNSHMPSTTALNTLDKSAGHLKGLSSGCNVIMVNYTPISNRKNYRIYDNKNSLNLNQVLDIVKQAGRKVDFSRGDSLKSKDQNKST